MELLVLLAAIGSFVVTITAAVHGRGHRGVYLGGAVLMASLAVNCLFMLDTPHATQADRGIAGFDKFGPFVGIWISVTGLALLVGSLMYRPTEATLGAPSKRP
jgi:hypothetical protein